MKEKPYLYRSENHNGWGNNISIFEWQMKGDPERVRLVGHLRRKPRKGDFITFKMESGKTLLTVVESVEYMSNPPDMWFATVFGEKYISEKDLTKLEMKCEKSPSFRFV